MKRRAGLIDQYVRETIFYREALAMGLDRDDTIIRRRLAQKLEFLSEDLVATVPPTEAELSAYFTEQRFPFTWSLGKMGMHLEPVYFAGAVVSLFGMHMRERRVGQRRQHHGQRYNNGYVGNRESHGTIIIRPRAKKCQ